MFTFLDDLAQTSRGFHQFARFANYKKQLYRNVEQQRQYWQRYHFSVPSDHLICKLLTTLPISFSRDVKSYYDAACDIAIDLTGTMRITNEAYAGRATERPWLFGKGFTEFPFVVFERVTEDIEALAKRWKDFEIIRFIRHPRTDLGIDLPNGKISSQESGIVIYQIDFPLLALAYRQFILEQAGRPQGSRETTQHFVSKYVLANALKSMVDVSFVNRLVAKFSNLLPDESKWRYAEAMPNHYEWVDNYIDDIIKQLRGNSYTFNELLNGITAISGTSLYELCALPDAYPSRQLIWLTYLAQIPYVEFLCLADAESDRGANNKYLNSIIRDLNYGSTDELWQSKLSAGLLREAESEVALIKSLCNALR